MLKCMSDRLSNTLLWVVIVVAVVALVLAYIAWRDSR